MNGSDTIMMKKTITLFAFVLIVASYACADWKVKAGLEEAPPPTTDSAYFNGQMGKLLNNLSENRSKKFRKAAILSFVNSDGSVSELGKMLTTKFGEQAMAKNHFKVIPSGQVKEALSTLKINNSNELTREQVGAIGKELDATAVITGVLYDLQKGSDVDLSVKAVQVDSGDLASAASINIYRSKQVQALIQQIVAQ